MTEISLYRRCPDAPPFRLLISDMDSTIIEQECLDELADFAGFKPRVAAITEAAMRGEIEFESALKERVALLKGMEAAVLETVFREHITLVPGAKEMITAALGKGMLTVLVSGGFTYFTARVAAAAGFHHHHGNTLEIVDGYLTGRVIEPILAKDAKLVYLKEYCHKLGITTDEAVALGDGANDLPMLQAAGLSVAYYAKPLITEACDVRITQGDLTQVIPFL